MYVQREQYLDRLIVRKHNGMVKVITGARRCGKSFLLFKIFREHLLIEGTPEDHIIELALDSKENERYLDSDKLYQAIIAQIKDDSMHYVLLDEIQLVDGFEPVINSLIRKDNLDIYVTGSNSRFLSSDIRTEFRGRGDEINVRPLSFSEFLSVYEGDKTDALDEYMDYGGLPGLLRMRTNEQKSEYLRNIMETTYLKDIVERNGIGYPFTLDNIVEVLSSSAGSLINPTKIKDTLKSKGYRPADEDTVVKYIGFLKDAFLFEEAKRYDIKGRKHIGALEKYYPVDHGISNAKLNFRQNYERSHIMENIIYNELRFRGYTVDIGMIRFTKTIEGKLSSMTAEVDFIARKGNLAAYIQSAYRIENEEKLEQELRPLKKIRDSFRKYVIIGDRMNPQSDDNGIVFMGLMQFLSDPNSIVL